MSLLSIGFKIGSWVMLSFFTLAFVVLLRKSIRLNFDILKRISFGFFNLTIGAIFDILARFSSQQSLTFAKKMIQLNTFFDFIGSFIILITLTRLLKQISLVWLTIICFCFGGVLGTIFFDVSFQISYSHTLGYWTAYQISSFFTVLNIAITIIFFLIFFILFRRLRSLNLEKSKLVYWCLILAPFFVFIGFLRVFFIPLEISFTLLEIFFSLSLFMLFIAFFKDPLSFSLLKGRIEEILIARNDLGNVPVAHYSTNISKKDYGIKAAAYQSIAMSLAGLLENEVNMKKLRKLQFVYFEDYNLHIFTYKQLTGYLFFRGDIERYKAGFKQLVKVVHSKIFKTKNQKTQETFEKKVIREKQETQETQETQEKTGSHSSASSDTQMLSEKIFKGLIEEIFRR